MVLARDFRVKLRAENDDFSRERQLLGVHHEIEAVHTRHVVVGDQKIVATGTGSEFVQRLHAVVGALYGMAVSGEDDASKLAQFADIFGIQDVKMMRY